MERSFALSPRVENVRDVNTVVVPVQFELSEIRNHFDESLNAIVSQFGVVDDLLSAGKDIEAKNILRSQIVFLEGILDFYLHEMTKYGLYKIFVGEWNRTEKYKKLSVPMSEVDRALNQPESKEWFFAFINNTFAAVVMQDWEVIKDQLNLIGVRWKDVCNSIYPGMDESHSIEEEKRVLKELYKRRNEIAHQNDRSHANAEQNDISHEYVEKSIEEVRRFVEAIHNVAVLNG